MIAGLRPAADITPAPPRTFADPLREAGIIATAVFAAALFGILTRPVGQLAAFWRVGGEEFAVLLPDCDRADAAAIAERILSAFAGTVVDLEDGREVSTTVSIGAAYVMQAPATLDALLLAADHALYQAKANGRNRIESEIIETL